MRFEYLNGPQDGRIIETDRQQFEMGRNEKNLIAMPYGPFVSDCHGKVRVQGDIVVFADTGNEGEGSTNGTTLRRQGRPPDYFKRDERELQPGDILVLGDNIWIKYLG